MAEPDRPRILLHLYATIFLISVAFGTALMLTPVYAEGLGVSYLDLGVLGAVGAATYAVMTLVAGALLDRFEKLRLYLAFNLFSAGTILLLYFTDELPRLILARGLLGVSSGAFFVAAGALTGEISPPERLTQSIGRYNLSWITGFIVGPFVGGVVSDLYGFSALWLVLAVTVLIADGLIWRRMIPFMQIRGSSEGFRLDLATLRRLRLAYVVMLPYALSIGIYFAFLPGYMAKIGISASVIGLLLTLNSSTKGLGFFCSERLVAWGTKRCLILGAFLLCISLFMVAYSSDALAFVVPLALYGVANGVFEPVILDFIAHKSPHGSLGTTMGAYEGTFGFAMCVGPLVAGIIAEKYPASAIYVFLAVASLLIVPFARMLPARDEP